MEYRKLIKFGESSHVVSLPTTWIREHKLKKGDLIYIEENGSKELMLFPKKQSESKEEKSITIKVDGKTKDMISREVISAYINDNKIIKLKGNDISKNFTVIRGIVNNLIALEIIEQTKNSVVARDFLKTDDLNIKGIMRRMDIIIKSMLIDARVVERGQHYENLANRDIDVNRLTFLAIRAAKKGLREPAIANSMSASSHDLSEYIRIVLYLEKIADAIKRLARHVKKAKLKKNEIDDLNEIYTLIEQHYHSVMKAYFTKDRELAIKTARRKTEMFTVCNEKCYKYDDVDFDRAIEKLREVVRSSVDIGRIVYMMGRIDSEE